MPEMDQGTELKNFYLNIPAPNEPFFLRGCNSLDWGAKNRLAKIFNPESGRTVMLAIDHGYFQGPTTGLERIDVTILPLLTYSDTLMLTRGILRSTIPPTYGKGIVLRDSARYAHNAFGEAIEHFFGGEEQWEQFPPPPPPFARRHLTSESPLPHPPSRFSKNARP